MSLLMENTHAKIGCGDPGDPIEFSALFDGSGYLSRTPSATGNRRLMCASFWMKRTDTSSTGTLFGRTETASSDSDYLYVPVLADGGISVDTHTGPDSDGRVETKSVYRNAAAHSHFHVVIDCDNVSGLARYRITKDGILQALDITTTPALGADIWANVAGIPFFVGVNSGYGGTDNFLKALLSEFAWFDGFAPDPSEFGRFNADGVWVHKDFSGKGEGSSVYGVNGFHNDFADPSDMGKDVSGNDNHLTVTGTIEQSADTPGWGNHSTLNPSIPDGSSTLSDGNLSYSVANNLVSEMMFSTLQTDGVGKFGAQVHSNTYQTGVGVVVGGPTVNFADLDFACLYYLAQGGIFATGEPSQTGLDTSAGVVEILVDHTAGEVRFVKGGTAIGAPVAIPGNQPVHFLTRSGSSSASAQSDWDFGQNGYVPSQAGFKPLSARNLACPPILDPSQYVQAPLTIGGGAVTSLWDCVANKTLIVSKRRDTVADFRLNVVIGGVQYTVAVNVGGAEVTDADGLTFTTNGFLLGADTQYQGTCEHFARRANPLAGIDFVLIDSHVVGQVSTIAHNCGGAIHRAWDIPLDGGDIRQFHHKMPAGDYTLVNVAGRGNDPDWFSSTPNTVSIGGASVAGRHLLILERGVPQFSSFDVYDGNGVVDGSMIPADFAPLSLDVVRGDAVGPHTVRTLRNGEANPVFKELSYDSEAAENQHSDTVYLLSNGAKCATNSANTGGQYTNANGGKYYTGMHALYPGKFANAR